MNVYPDKLKQTLQRKLMPAYFFSGDEPLQMMEAADLVRSHCREAGYTESERFHVDNARSFDWQAFLMSGNSMSLFGDRKVVNLYLPSGKPGTEGASTLKKWCEAPPSDAVLIIISGKPEGRFQNSAWFKAIDKIGVTMQVWPLSAQKMHGWVQQRMTASELHADNDAVNLLVDRVEGNLLAARQEIEKLAILHRGQRVTAKDVVASVTDSSRYTILDLIEASLSSDTARSLKVLDGLKAAGDSPVLVCWHLASEVRKIINVLARMDAGENPSQAMFKSGVWKNRQPLVSQVIRQRPRLFWLRAASDCSYLDRLSKGMASGDLWTEISAFVTRLSGTRWPLLRSADVA
jgi:DNA polymerase-3 subunit delta